MKPVNRKSFFLNNRELKKYAIMFKLTEQIKVTDRTKDDDCYINYLLDVEYGSVQFISFSFPSIILAMISLLV